jgi:hypothetical protein
LATLLAILPRISLSAFITTAGFFVVCIFFTELF